MDQVDEILLILRHGGPAVHAIVPALIPDEAGQFIAAAFQGGKFLIHVCERFPHLLNHERIIFSNFAARGRRTEIAIQTFSAPCSFDNQNRILNVIAHDMAELQFWTEMMLIAIHGKTQTERPREQRLVFALITHPNIFAHGPFAVGTFEMLEQCGLRGIGHQLHERAFAVVVVRSVQIYHGLTFHIGLTGEDEDFYRFRWVDVRPGGERRKNQGCDNEQGSFHNVIHSFAAAGKVGYTSAGSRPSRTETVCPVRRFR